MPAIQTLIAITRLKMMRQSTTFYNLPNTAKILPPLDVSSKTSRTAVCKLIVPAYTLLQRTLFGRLGGLFKRSSLVNSIRFFYTFLFKIMN